MFLLNKQEVFDKIITGLRRQGKKSLGGNSGRVCMYRGNDGCKCAVGQIIPDEFYFPLMEGWGIGRSDVRRVLSYIVEQSALDLVADMQFIHDRIDVTQWELEFKSAALNHNLIYV